MVVDVDCFPYLMAQEAAVEEVVQWDYHSHRKHLYLVPVDKQLAGSGPHLAAQ